MFEWEIRHATDRFLYHQPCQAEESLAHCMSVPTTEWPRRMKRFTSGQRWMEKLRRQVLGDLRWLDRRRNYVRNQHWLSVVVNAHDRDRGRADPESPDCIPTVNPTRKCELPRLHLSTHILGFKPCVLKDLGTKFPQATETKRSRNREKGVPAGVGCKVDQQSSSGSASLDTEYPAS